MMQTDEITRRRVESNNKPDYLLQLEIIGHRIGATGKTQWLVGVGDHTDNINPEDNEQLAAILGRVIEILK